MDLYLNEDNTRPTVDIRIKIKKQQQQNLHLETGKSQNFFLILTLY